MWVGIELHSSDLTCNFVGGGMQCFLYVHQTGAFALFFVFRWPWRLCTCTFFVFRWSRRLCTRTFLFLVGRRGRPLPLFLSAGLQRRPISLQTEVCGDTLEQTRWARQLTGQTGAASAIFFGDARARQVSVGDGHQRSTNDCRAPCLGHPPTRGSSSWSTRQTRSC